uniref:HAUS augmin-like complex subunit 6 n=1 Tax=Anthurium amnicola TaxID=1678845 RepID=A0A1D1Y0Z2_9ARAE
MATDREKEREAELESAMYTNCLLLGLEPAILGNSGGPRVGLFRHSNPKMGEQLLYFLLCALRGPVQSAKDFDKVWPIFDSAQSRDFRKIVQGIISELESQGALPRSNSRVSSLATCCGPRFVELLWQLSVHALREVHRRTFAADVASNPLPASLTDVSYLHAASLLPITKARIALERRKFLKNASIAVHRQATWSNLANEMTAEFRALCAEEAYLQQELEKLQDLRNKAKLDGELWDDRLSSSLGQNSHLVSKATRLWESLLSRKSQHEVLASGPIEDLIAHREHRYRISGSSLLAAMDLSSSVPYSDTLPVQSDDSNPQISEWEQVESSHFQGNNETLCPVDVRDTQPTVDIAEVLRCWTHALQRIHKQSLHLVKANDGGGPELLRCSSDSDGCHIESLAATLAEHRQHLVSIQGLINQLKEEMPAMQQSIAELTEEVGSMSSMIPLNEYNGRSTSQIQAQASGRPLEQSTDEVVELASKLSATQLEKSATSPALKLPHLFSATPNSSGKGAQTLKRHGIASQTSKVGTLPEGKQVVSGDHADNAEQGDIHYIQNLKRSVREAALSSSSNHSVRPQERSADDDSEHFFMPLTESGVSHWQTDAFTNGRKQRLIFSPVETHDPNSRTSHTFELHEECRLRGLPDLTKDEADAPGNSVSRHLPTVNLDNTGLAADSEFYDIDEALDQVLSPPLLLDSSFFSDTYEDLLAPLSETDAALMER